MIFTILAAQFILSAVIVTIAYYKLYFAKKQHASLSLFNAEQERRRREQAEYRNAPQQVLGR